MSLKTNITEYLKQNGSWVHKGELGKKAVLEWGFENENMGRRCRELENAGVIERELRKNPKTGVWEAWYKINGSGQTVSHLPHKQEIVGSIPTSRTNFCCPSYSLFQVHAKTCSVNAKKENVLF